jgi:alkylhydroperoxidase/carboxymuconolactone decarboxylase family protein YurZ
MSWSITFPWQKKTKNLAGIAVKTSKGCKCEQLQNNVQHVFCVVLLQRKVLKNTGKMIAKNILFS